MKDIFDTRFEGKTIELGDGKIGAGEDHNLMTKDPALRMIQIGMGWDVNVFEGAVLDLDVSVFLLGRDGQTRMDEDFVFYNNLAACDEAIKHNGDSLSGAGEGDDETISIDLHGVPLDVMQLAVALSIYKGEEKSQTLGMVRNAYLRILNRENRFELLRFELDPVLAEREETGAIIGFLNREGPKWHFHSAFKAVAGGLPEIARGYGLQIIQH